MKRQADGRFVKGISGNPGGRPRTRFPLSKKSNPGAKFVSRSNSGRFEKGSSGYRGRGDKIYIAWHEGDFYKIGVADNPRSRMAMLESNTPYKTELIYLRQVENALDIEYALHKMFESKRVKGEWFRLDKTDLDYIQRFVEELSSDPICVQLELDLDTI